MSIVRTSEWQAYIKADKKGRYELHDSEWFANLSADDLLELIELCRGAATAQEEAAAVDLLYWADFYAIAGDFEEKKLEPAFRCMTGPMINLARRHFPDEISKTALRLVRDTDQAKTLFLIEEVDPAVLSEEDLTFVCSQLAAGGSAGSVDAIKRLKAMVKGGGLPAKIAASQLLQSRLATHGVIDRLKATWRGEPEVGREKVVALYQVLKNPSSRATPESILKAANRWVKKRHVDDLNFLYNECVTRAMLVPIQLVLDVLGEPTSKSGSSCWYKCENPKNIDAGLYLEQDAKGRFIACKIS